MFIRILNCDHFLVVLCDRTLNIIYIHEKVFYINHNMDIFSLNERYGTRKDKIYKIFPGNNFNVTESLLFLLHQGLSFSIIQCSTLVNLIVSYICPFLNPLARKVILKLRRPKNKTFKRGTSIAISYEL